ncbi:MAG TPA: hypothetical protein VD864_13290 [Nocardioides sp.]|nr:hypothetical protein [Nocardioides sp.]
MAQRIPSQRDIERLAALYAPVVAALQRDFARLERALRLAAPGRRP